eukprot:15040000-Alexandrium_andersonii.AAC.1
MPSLGASRASSMGPSGGPGRPFIAAQPAGQEQQQAAPSGLPLLRLRPARAQRARPHLPR